MYMGSGIQERKEKPRRSEMDTGNLFQMGNLDFQSFVQCGSLLSETTWLKIIYVGSSSLSLANANVSFPNALVQRVET